MSAQFGFKLYPHSSISLSESLTKSREFYELMKTRRTVRDIRSDNIPTELLENLIKAAGTAPSGANKQPWFFCVVRNAELKKKIRSECEIREKENYEKRYPKQFLEDIGFLGTDYEKKFLETAPALIVFFKKRYNEIGDATVNNYYVSESCGIALGMLFTAIHNAGLVTVPYTPMPRSFLNDLLGRPRSESAVMILPIGYPNEFATVPEKMVKPLSEIMKIY